MSYILSALRKADLARKSGDIPTALSPGPEAAPGFTRNLPYKRIWFIIGGFLLAAAIVILYWLNIVKIPFALLPDDHLSPSQQSPSPSLPPPRAAAIPETIAPAATLRSVPADPGQAVLPARVLPQPDDAPPVLLEPGRMVDYDQLPDAVKADFLYPHMTGHLYSAAQARARKIIINDVMLRENQSLENGLTVEEILADGAIMNFRGYRFRLYADQMF